MTFRLLFADDSATMHRVVQITVAQERIELLAARDGREALELSHKTLPDAALVDVHMPEMDGYELCRELKQDPRTAHVPVVLLFSSQHPLDEARAQSVGADDSIAKPFESQALLDKLAAVRGMPRHRDAAGAAPSRDAHPAAGASAAQGLGSSSYAAVPPSPAAQVPFAAAGERPSFFGGAARTTGAQAQPPQGAQAPQLAQNVHHEAPQISMIPGVHAAAQPAHEAHAPFVAPPNEDITLVGARPVLAPRERSVSRVVQFDTPQLGAPPPQRLTEQPSGPASGAASSWLHDNVPGAAGTGPLPSREALSSATLSGLPELPSWEAPYAPHAAPMSPMGAAPVPATPAPHAAPGAFEAPHPSFAAMSPERHPSAPPAHGYGAAAMATPYGAQTNDNVRELVRDEVARQLPQALMAYFAQLSPEQREGLLGAAQPR